mmetsp:Transcript_13781/g.50172  ORF Transcript_13781/g.50172 Transcript_13781/m.50172 type:complete len:325 (+) Transcript_13781:91-1065(+)
MSAARGTSLGRPAFQQPRRPFARRTSPHETLCSRRGHLKTSTVYGCRRASTSPRRGGAHSCTSACQEVNANSPESASVTQDDTAPAESRPSEGLLTGSAGSAPGLAVFSKRSKLIVLVRHGYSSWNQEGRVQGNSDHSVLTYLGRVQARRCRQALEDINFDACFSSPITRARVTAEMLWEGRSGEIIYNDYLKEANLYELQGLLNSEAKVIYPDRFATWRNKPHEFVTEDGHRPVQEVFESAVKAWRCIEDHPGDRILVVTHKSILRAMIDVALGLGPESFRAFDINNAGICAFALKPGQPAVLTHLNLTFHLTSPEGTVKYNF